MDCDQRKVWVDERERRGVVSGRVGFGSDGLFARLDRPGVVVFALSAEPGRPMLDFRDARLLGALPERFTGITRNAIELLPRVATTSTSIVRYSDANSPGSPWRGMVALRRDGGVEVAIGSPASRLIGSESLLANRTAYHLYVLVHAARLVTETQARLLELLAMSELLPLEINVAVPGALGALLDGFAAGWPAAGDFGHISECLEEDPLVRLEVEEWPEDTTELVISMAQRVCEAFGIRETRYLVGQDHREAGQLLPATPDRCPSVY